MSTPAPREDAGVSTETLPAPTVLRAAESAPIPPMLTTLSQPISAAAEAIRALRTHVLSQHIHAGRRGLAIGAPSVNVGCTYVAANLAVALAQVGLKTLLVDGDLRAPGVDKIIPPRSATGGLAACLAATDSRIGDYIDVDLLPNLSVLFAGEPSANSQELLAREWFGDVMRQCLRDFDITIVDTPPANTSADARRISNIIGYGLVVARRHKSLVSDVRVFVEQLIDDHVTVIGTVMNAD
jgi:capsular exopolysaccharide synthesis family protein